MAKLVGAMEDQTAVGQVYGHGWLPFWQDSLPFHSMHLQSALAHDQQLGNLRAVLLVMLGRLHAEHEKSGGKHCNQPVPSPGQQW